MKIDSKPSFDRFLTSTYLNCLIKNVAHGGGYLLGSANSVTKSVPLKNYQAMSEATFEYGNYPISEGD